MNNAKKLANTISSLPEEQLTDFLEGILSESELEQIAARLEIVELLRQGVSQHEIAKRLEIGVATVSRGAKMLKQGKFDYTWG
ncbi:MAG: Trp family transcriptional regulator [Candidatus Dojkabacteria bacterium]